MNSFRERTPAETPTLLLLLGLALLGQTAGAQSLITNGSFEAGGLPTGWRARPGGSVTMGDAHRGVRSVGGDVKRWSVVWESDSAALSPYTDYRLEGWIRCPAGEGRLDMELIDVTGQVLRRMATPTIRRVANWQYAAVEWNAAEATLARVMFSVQGKADLDDVVLAPVAASFIGNKSAEGDDRGRRSQERRFQVFVNQLGYELGGPKTAVVAANFLPSDAAELNVQLLTAKGSMAGKRSVPCAGRVASGTTNDWGWYFWRVDFSDFPRTGVFRVAAQAGGAHGESPLFQIGRDLLLKETAQSAVDFFFVQRCGFEVPGWHKACHLDDANLPDGTHIDATGGWHSAGDYNKLMYENGDGGVVFALLTAQSKSPEVFSRFDRDANGWCDALDEAEWGAKFVAKMQIPETGGLRNTVNQGPGRNWTKWSAPEDHTDNQAGTADDPVIQPGEGNSPLIIGGWARLSLLLKPRGVTNDYLARAIRLWNHASKDGTQVGSPHLLLSAIEMHRATGEAAYLDYARRSVESLLAQQVTNGIHRGAFGDYGELSAGALASFALAYPDSESVPQIQRALTGYVTFCVRTANNPFGLCTRTADDANGFFPPDLGNNFVLLMRAWAASLAYQVTHDSRALGFAADQVDWILGKNPVGLCMFEGKGTLNPPRYHHRYNMIPGRERGAVPGTIPNGFVREMGLVDRPGFDLSRAGGRSPSYRTSEPWLVHNMWYLLAMSAWHDAMIEAARN